MLSPSDDLESLLARVPLTSGSAFNHGGACLVRADLDVPIKNGRVVDVARLASLADTIAVLRSVRKVPVLLGHIGRRPDNTSLPLVPALEQLYSARVFHVGEWFADALSEPSQELQEAIRLAASCDGVVLLENTRKYAFETALWGKSPDAVDEQALNALIVPARALARVARTYISDCIASSNPDWSSLVLPFVAEEATLADGVATEIEQHVIPCSQSTVLIFSGLKPDKLDDLEQIVSRRAGRTVVIGGALAFPFLAAAGNIPMDERDPRLNSDRVEQARRITNSLARSGGTLLVPSDFAKADGTTTSTPRDTDDALDIGPATAKAFDSFLRSLVRDTCQLSVYMNGVLGVVEDARFQAGTRSLFDSLRYMTKHGATTYVGGGDCAAALRHLGDEAWVSHVFTAGGTVLKAMSGRSISFLSALAYAAQRSER